MRIYVKSIEQSDQRYPTVGDWWFEANGDLEIRISNMRDERMVQLVAVHEIVEALLCKARGISEESVSAFDIKFEHEREHGAHSETAEPGDHKDAPYRKEHFFATSLERMLSAELGINWEEYDAVIQSL